MRTPHVKVRDRARRLIARATAFVVAGLTLGGAPLLGQATQPVGDGRNAGAAGDAQALVATITAVKGIVQVRSAEDQPWAPAKVGMELDEGAEFRTGPRSAVQFVIPPDQTITLDRLGTIKVLQAVKDSGKVTTALGMKYGRTRYDVKAADLEHDSTIRSPGSTLAIRGTDVTFEDMAPFEPSAVSREGRAMFRTTKREFVAFGGTRRALVAANRGGPAETALVRTRTDPQSAFSGRSPAEQTALLQLPSFGGHDPGRRGFLDRRRLEGQPIFGGGPIPPGPGPAPGPTPEPNPEIMPGDIITGRLQFDLDWDGIPFTNVDLTVARGDGEILAPGFNPVPSGGRHLGDEEGNSAGVGRESVVWDTSFPADFYYVQAELRNDAPVRAGLTVTHDVGGQTRVIHQSGPTVLDPRGDLFFGLHVAAPPDLPGPPPPLPPPPPMPVGPLPAPQPGPDETQMPG